MRKPPIEDLVYNRSYPRPRQQDPNSFLTHVQRCLVPEVREEVQRYFGLIDCLEAQYPGLDYSFLPHRRRLASFPWHRRLFRVFDELRLTNDEILHLCTWEGTRAAKERFERESRTKIEMTTLNGVATEPVGDGPRAILHTKEQPSKTIRQSYNSHKRKPYAVAEQSDDDADESFGVHLNQNLMAAAEARERGEAARFDLQWEQWMKEAIERNEMDTDSILESLRQGRPFPPSSVEPDGDTGEIAEFVPHLPSITDTDTPTVSSSPRVATTTNEGVSRANGGSPSNGARHTGNADRKSVV